MIQCNCEENPKLKTPSVCEHIPKNEIFSPGQDFIAYVGKYLGFSGIDLALIEAEAFGKFAVENSVMTRVYYCKGKEAVSLVSELMAVLLFEQFEADHKITACELNQRIERDQRGGVVVRASAS